MSLSISAYCSSDAPIDPPRAAAVAAVVGRWALALFGREPPVESAALLYMPYGLEFMARAGVVSKYYGCE